MKGPREVSPLVRVAVLLGGFANQMGWGCMVVGSVLLWVLAPDCDWRGLVPGERPTAAAQGVVVGEFQTGHREGGRKRQRGTPVFGVRYRYEVAGRSYEGTSYRRGPHGPPGARVAVDDEVADPARSRIRGLRPAPLPAGMGVMVLLFPAIGLGFLAYGVRQGLRRQFLLTEGALVRGRFLGDRVSPPAPTRRKVRAYTFEYEVGGVQYRVDATTDSPETIQDEERERILYDPERPERAEVLDSLPGGPLLEVGGVACGRPWKAFACLLLPGFVLAANALGAALLATP